jgi:hypothetical protein
VIYGDVGTSPLYVYSETYVLNQNPAGPSGAKRERECVCVCERERRLLLLLLLSPPTPSPLLLLCLQLAVRWSPQLLLQQQNPN